MATELTMTGNKKIATVQKEFSSKFEYLQLRFEHPSGRKIDESKSIAQVREKNNGELSVIGNQLVGTFEAAGLDKFGLTLEVAYSQNGKFIRSSGDKQKMSIAALNRWCRDNGYEKQ